MKAILHDLEEIQEKLRENFTQKGALEEQTQGELMLFGRGGWIMEAGAVSVPRLHFEGAGSLSPAACSLGCE